MYRRANKQSHLSHMCRHVRDDYRELADLHLLAKTQVEVGCQLCMFRTHDCAVFRSCHNSEHSNVVRERRILTEGKVPVPVDDNQPCDSRGKAWRRLRSLPGTQL